MMADPKDVKAASPDSPYQGAYPTMVEDEGGGFDLRGMLAFARRWRRVIFGVALVGTAAAAFYAYSRPPVYTARALVMIKPENSRVVNVEAVMAGLSSDTATIETQIRFLSSREMLEQLVDKLGMENSRQPLPEPPAPPFEPLRQLTTQATAALGDWLGSDWLFTIGLANEQALLAPEESEELVRADKAAALVDNLQIRQEGRSLVLSIAYSSTSPAEATRIANGLADLYIEEQIGEKQSATQKASDWLEIRLQELQNQVLEAEGAIEKYRAENDLQENKGIMIQSQQIANLTTMLVDTRAQRNEKESRLGFIRGLKGRTDSMNAVSEVLNSPYMARLWEQDQELGRRAAELRNDYGERHPQVLSLRAEQDKVQDKIQSELQRIVANMANEVEVLAAREQSIETDINDLIAKTDVAGQAEVKLRELERQASATRELYENFLLRYKETREQEQLAEANARIIARAKEPSIPASTPPKFFVLLGFVGSSALGVLFGWLIERLDNTLRSGKEIERYLGIPCLALVPFLSRSTMKKSKKVHEYLVSKPLSVYAETLRSIYTALRVANVDNPPKVIHVTSSAPSEGKTVLTVSLAVSLAQSGFRTVVIDLDLRHPSVVREITPPDGGRLVDYLIGEVGLDEVIYREPSAKIDVIAVGKPAANPTALVSSQRLRDLIATLRERYDYVIVDSPPALGVSDTKIIAGLTDTTLFLLRWGETTRDVAEDALKDLLDHGIRVTGAVMSQVDLVRHAQYGYGGIDHYYTKYNKYYTN
jgi:exopolysaccharide transport family protein